MSVELVFRERINNPLIANTWPEFLECIKSARTGLGNPSTIWYRGMSRADYKLLPSLYRFPNGIEKEKDLFNEYERSAARLTTKRSNDWELLFDMQHYGIPTRLLDWTDVLGVAIAFALYNTKDDDQDSSIHVLDPKKLNSKSGIPEIRRPITETNFEYKKIYWHDIPFKAIHPIAIDSPLQNDRMVAQQGAFTLHGSYSDYFDTDGQDCLRKIVMKAGAKPGAREFLEYSNLNAFSIYPDIMGMARHIVRKHLG
ncbi:FRG domain-containing protein [Delftia acidovorans]|jgi:hypothetical protein|uniref:FRG domain-containing protein n=1 Tax=Delftia acidovorans TaxID=80866 RepID=UPI00284A5387|nr:FRG domain-containing protein [Delftia acidovorans]